MNKKKEDLRTYWLIKENGNLHRNVYWERPKPFAEDDIKAVHWDDHVAALRAERRAALEEAEQAVKKHVYSDEPVEAVICDLAVTAIRSLANEKEKQK